MTVYGDVLFLVNAAVDYLLLRIGAKLCAYPLPRRRALVASFFGGLCALAQVLCVPVVQSWWGKALAFGGMAAIAFGLRRRALRPASLTLLCSAALAGVMLLLVRVFSLDLLIWRGTVYYPVTARVLILVSGTLYLLSAICFAGVLRHGRGEIVPIRLTLGGQTVVLPSLYDTGHSLKEPIGGREVVILSPERFRELVGISGREFPANDAVSAVETLHALRPEFKAQLVPFRAVGVRDGMMAAVGCTMSVGRRRPQKVLAALSPTPMAEKTYEALIGGSAK